MERISELSEPSSSDSNAEFATWTSFEMVSEPSGTSLVHRRAGPTREDFSYEDGQDDPEKIDSNGKRCTVRGSSEDSV